MIKNPLNPLALGKAPSQRQLRVAEEIKHTLSAVFIRGDFTNPDLISWFESNSLTLTQVHMSPDLKSAKVYVVTLGDLEDISSKDIHKKDKSKTSSITKDLVKLLNTNLNELRFLMGKNLGLKSIPSLRFYADDTFNQVQRIENLINQARERDKKIQKD